MMPEHDFDIALAMYADHLTADYYKDKSTEFSYQVSFKRGRKFVKIMCTSLGAQSVSGFVCIEPHDKWKFGDILKAASWATPAKNFARGNILDTKSYASHRWTGAQ